MHQVQPVRWIKTCLTLLGHVPAWVCPTCHNKVGLDGCINLTDSKERMVYTLPYLFSEEFFKNLLTSAMAPNLLALWAG